MAAIIYFPTFIYFPGYCCHSVFLMALKKHQSQWTLSDMRKVKFFSLHYSDWLYTYISNMASVLLTFPLAFMQEGNEVQTRLLVFRSGASHVTTPDGSSTLISPPSHTHPLQPVAVTAAAFASSQSALLPTASTPTSSRYSSFMSDCAMLTCLINEQSITINSDRKGHVASRIPLHILYLNKENPVDY